MNRLILVFVPALFAVGCSEYDIVGDGDNFGDNNPPNIETPVQTDRVVQTTVASVDVLWVIDTSCSMSQEQAQLAANFEGFMTYFLDSGLEYHIGVVSTNMDTTAYDMQGKLQPGGAAGQYLWIDPNTPDPVDVFQDMALLGTDSHYYEQGMDAVYAALETEVETYNAGFFRDDANLAVVVISDEDDYSEQAPGQNIQREAFKEWLTDLKPSSDYITFSSIVGDELGPNYYDTCDTAIEQGTDYLWLTREIGGIEWSICDSNWDQALEQLGMQAAGLRREFFLSQVPVEDSLEVWVEVDGEVENVLTLDVDFSYDRSRNSIRMMNFVPEPLSEVFIEYEVASEYIEPPPE